MLLLIHIFSPVAMNQNKIKHLEFIQNLITRMNTNSFIIKGWCITLISAFLVLSLEKLNKNILLISFPTIIIFGFLDTYHLVLEKSYRALYDFEIKKEKSDFNMNISHIKKNISLHKVFFKSINSILYLFLFFLVVISYFIL